MITISNYKLSKLKLFLVISIASIYGCDEPTCSNEDPIFERLQPTSVKYKRHLAEKIRRQDPNDINYWFTNYYEKDGSKFILFNIHGNGLCAKIELEINTFDEEIEQLVRNKGKGYRGAELRNVAFDIIEDSTTTIFRYKSISGIID